MVRPTWSPFFSICLKVMADGSASAVSLKPRKQELATMDGAPPLDRGLQSLPEVMRCRTDRRDQHMSFGVLLRLEHHPCFLRVQTCEPRGQSRRTGGRDRNPGIVNEQRWAYTFRGEMRESGFENHRCPVKQREAFSITFTLLEQPLYGVNAA